jgi:cardiolipin synthase
LDPRSLRLNFELDLEVYDRALAQQLDARIDTTISNAERITIRSLMRRSFALRLRDKIVWLASPYL